MTAEELQSIEARCNAATPAPWRVHGYAADVVYDGDRDDIPDTVLACPDLDRVRAGTEQMRLDAEFCAHARTDVPALVVEVRRLRAELATERRNVDTLVTSIDALREKAGLNG